MTEAIHLFASNRCRICAAPNESLHLGTDACRACATFFKRAKQSGATFPCRQGDNKCSLLRNSGSKCRGCRYRKCIEIGMVYDAPVQGHNENNNDEFLSDFFVDFKPIYSTNKKENSLLERIAREYVISVERRRVQERELIREHDLKQLEHPTEEVYMATHTSAIAAYKLAAYEVYHFFHAVFPSAKELPLEDQRELFRLHFMQFQIVDAAYRTMCVWGEFDQYSFCSVLMCTDVERPEQWIGMNEGGPKRDEFLESMRTYVDVQKPVIIPAYEKAELCEREHHALIALLLCESDSADLPNGLSDQSHIFLENIRREILDDLQHFYTSEMGLNDYSARLGNLMTICHTFREGCMNFREFFRMHVTIFDVYTTETLLQELLL